MAAIVIGIVIWIVNGLICGFLGKIIAERGNSEHVTLWCVLSFIFGWLVLIVMICLQLLGEKR